MSVYSADYQRGICPAGFIDIRKVAEKLGVGLTTAWGCAKSPGFPTKYKFGTRTSRWKECEIDEWIERQIAAAETVRGGR